MASRREFVADALTLTVGTAIAQGIAVLVAPLLTRLYQPSDFGAYALYISLFSLLVPLANARYSLAIMLPKEDRIAFGILQLCFLLSAAFGVVLFLLSPTVGDLMSRLVRDVRISSWIWLLPVSVVVGSMFQSLFLWINRGRRFTLMGAARITRVSGMVAIQCVSALMLGTRELGLVVGHLVGYILGSLSLGYEAIAKGTRPVGWVGLGDMKSQALRYVHFPMYMSWGGLMDGFSIRLTPILLALFFASSVVGFYALAFSVISVPIVLIGRSVSNVLFQRATEKKADAQEVSSLVCRVLSWQAFISAPVALVLFLAGPGLFAFVFGTQWRVSGEFVQILAPMFFMQFTVSVLSMVLIALERQRQQAFIQSLLFLCAVVPLLAGGFFTRDPHKTLILFSVFQTFAYAMYLTTICKAASVSFRDVVKNLHLKNVVAGWQR